MLKVLAILFGLVLIMVGILGFLPEYAPAGKLFGIFSVNAAHNIIHAAVGVIAVLCGFSSSAASKAFFIVFGIVYAALAGIGFYTGEEMLFGTVATNTADNWLHVGIAVICLYLGLFIRRK